MLFGEYFFCHSRVIEYKIVGRQRVECVLKQASIYWFTKLLSRESIYILTRFTYIVQMLWDFICICAYHMHIVQRFNLYHFPDFNQPKIKYSLPCLFLIRDLSSSTRLWSYICPVILLFLNGHSDSVITFVVVLSLFHFLTIV